MTIIFAYLYLVSALVVAMKGCRLGWWKDVDLLTIIIVCLIWPFLLLLAAADATNK